MDNESQPMFPVERPSWDTTCMKMVGLLAERVSCIYHKVGCLVLSSDHLILATGYNGPPRGFPHCTEVGCSKDKGKNCIGSHAEQNAITFCLGSPFAVLKGATWYLTVLPCNQCMKTIVNTKPSRLVFLDVYVRRSGGVSSDKEDALIIAEMAGIKVEQYNLVSKTTTIIIKGENDG